MGEGVRCDHLHVVRIPQHDLPEHGKRPLGELDAILGEFLELRKVLRLERLAHATGLAEDRMNDLAAEIRDQFAQPAPGGDDLLAGIEADLADHADDVALLRGRFRSDDEIRPAQHKYMQRVILEHERVVDQFADFPAG